MLLFLLPVVLGAAVGLSRGGRFERLRRVRFRLPGILLVALGIQASLVHVRPAWRLPLVLATYAAAGAWVAVNLAGRSGAVRLALGLIALGWALNLMVMEANGGMPVSTPALEQIGLPAEYNVADGHFSKHVVADTETALYALGDVIAVPPLRAVISPGDVVLAAGVATLVAAAMGTGGRRRAGVVADLAEVS